MSLGGLDPAGVYELVDQCPGRTERVAGAVLAQGFRLAIPNRQGSLLIVYRTVTG